MVVQGRGEYVGVELKEDWSCFDIIETGDGYPEGFFCMCLEFSIMKVKEKKHKTLAKFHWHSPEGTNLFLPFSGPIKLGVADGEGWRQVWAQIRLRKVSGSWSSPDPDNET